MLRAAALRLPQPCARPLSGGGAPPTAGARRRPLGRRWTAAEDAALARAVAADAGGRGLWSRVAEAVGGGRTFRGCRYRYAVSLQRHGVRFSLAEDRRLLAVLEEFRGGEDGGERGEGSDDHAGGEGAAGAARPGRAGFVHWPAVARAMGSKRGGDALRERWTERLDPRLKLGRFESWEDEVLRDAVAEWGRDWARAAERLPGRSRTMCLQRWLAIEPGKRKGPFSAEEDARLLEVRARLVRERGEENVTFGDVADDFGPGRNRVQCQRRYAKLVKMKEAEAHAKVIRGSQAKGKTRRKVDRPRRGISLRGRGGSD